MRNTSAIAGLILAAAVAPGCVSDETAEVGSHESDVTELRDLYKDAKNLDLGDLLHVSADFASDEINDVLAVSDFASMRLSPPEIYALDADAQGDLTLHSLNELYSGLATRFGEKELTTEVNRVRRDHLQTSGDAVYVESAFKVRVGAHNWGHETGGLDDLAESAWGRIGFDASKELEARLVSAYDGELNAVVDAPLATAKAIRGFVLPRSTNDIRAMKPGESYALRGTGRLGVNAGVGVPFMIASHGAFSYDLVFSASVRALFEGTLDIQVVRLQGDRIVIDVGVDDSFLRSARVALEDGWGVHGLVETNVSLGGLNLDLGRLVDKAVKRQLNKKLDLVNASWEKTNLKSRVSVARFRIGLDSAAEGSAVDSAIAQLLHGDLRLAQALANGQESGIETEFEISRSGVASTSYAGIDLFGMKFFRELEENEGTIVIQTPGGARSIYFESLHKESGWFFSSHGYARTGLSGINFDPSHPQGGERDANLLFQVVEGDKLMERDKLLDHLDGVIVGIGGAAALAAIEGPANELERFVEQQCPNSEAFDPCRESVLDNPQVAQLRANGMSAVGSAVSGLDNDVAQLVLDAAELRLAAQAAYEPKASFVGPPTSVVVDYRMDDGALSSVLGARSRADVEAAAMAYLQASLVKRIESPEKIADKRDDIAEDYRSLVDAIGDRFEERQTNYQRILDAENTTLAQHPELGQLGTRAIEISVPVDSNNTVRYEDAIASSLVKQRAGQATALLDDLIEVADGNKIKRPEQVVAYTLLGLTPQSRIDFRLDVDMDLGNSFAQNYEHYIKAGYKNLDIYARGSEVSPIGGGIFDIEELIDID